MLMIALTVALVLVVPIVGGDLAALTRLRLRGVPLIATALAVQVLIISVLRDVPHLLAASIHVLTYVAAAVVIWLNRRVPGIVVLGLGAALNALAITVNGGELPASAAAVRASGMSVADGHYANSGPIAHAHLAFLGDIFATPHWLPFANVFSIGDVLIMLGAAVLLFRVCGTRRRRPLQPSTSA